MIMHHVVSICNIAIHVSILCTKLFSDKISQKQALKCPKVTCKTTDKRSIDHYWVWKWKPLWLHNDLELSIVFKKTMFVELLHFYSDHFCAFCAKRHWFLISSNCHYKARCLAEKMVTTHFQVSLTTGTQTLFLNFRSKH